MEVTVVIPVLNRADLIVRCLDSVAAQTCLPRRIIVVDNGSTDGTQGAIEDWRNTHPEIELLLIEEKKQGAARARQRGLKEVDTEFVYFLDSDDEMMPDLIEKATKAIGDADIVHWKVKQNSLDGEQAIKPYYESSLLRRQFYNSILCTVSYMARTEVMRKTGGWNESLRVWDDWELGIRILLSTNKINHLSETMVLVHCQEESITGTNFSPKEGEWERAVEIAERDIRHSGRSISEKSRLLDMLCYKRIMLAAAYRREGNKKAAQRLIDQVMSEMRLNRRERLFLKTAYHYRRFGGRGAYYLWR